MKYLKLTFGIVSIICFILLSVTELQKMEWYPIASDTHRMIIGAIVTTFFYGLFRIVFSEELKD